MAAFQPYYIWQFASTTLNVPGGINNSQTTGIILDSVPADIDITKPGIVCISYANPLLTSVAEFVTYTSINGSNELQGVTRGAEGYSAKSHANSVTVAWVVSKSHINEVMDALTGVDTGILLNLADLNGTKLIIDADADTSITADTDDQIDVEVAGSDKFRLKSTDFDIVTATGNIQVAGADPKRTMYVPASAMFPSTTSPCASLTQVESSTNDVNIKVLDFDGAGTSKEYAEFGIQAPSYWDLGTVTAQFVWYATAGSGTVNWEIQGLALSDDDALDAAYGTLQEVTDTLTATGDVHITAETSAITIAGTPAAGDWLQFKIARDPANDTNTSDARLMGVRIRFGISQYNDA
jgi:hypothetical protein